MRLTSLVLAMGLSAVASQSVAAEAGFYFGLSGGRAEHDVDRPRSPVAFGASATPTLPPSALLGSPYIRYTPSPVAYFGAATAFSAFVIPGGYSLYGPRADDSDTTWSAHAGYQANRYVAVELSYVDLGEIRGTTTFSLPIIVPGPLTTVQLRESLETRGGSFAVIGTLPLTDRWDVYGRAGVFYLDSEFSTAVGGAKLEMSQDSRGSVFGVGTQFTFASRWSVRAEMQRYSNVSDDLPVDEFDIDTLTLSVLFRM